ncbi:hypothetical protein AA0120_g10187 [Alternaria tenuissima]|nr:hypothetical protein AA0120_g10187 [Alternaria tenuissima]
MNDHDSKRRAPFHSHGKLPHHGRPNVSIKKAPEKPRNVRESHVQPRQKGSISPPPLKRQRTTYDKFNLETRDPLSTNRKAHLPTSSNALRHSFSEHTETASAASSKRKPDTVSISKSFPAPPAPPPRTASSNRLLENKSDTHVEPEPARLTTKATTADKLIKPKKAPDPSQPPVPKPIKRTEIPNTPSQGSSQTDSSIPEKSFRHLRRDQISQQSLHTQDDENTLPLDTSVHVVMSTPSMTLRSTCQKQGDLAKSAEIGVQCSSCRISTRFAETGRLEIPETPDINTIRKPSLLPSSSASSTAPIAAPTVDDPVSSMASPVQNSARLEAEPDLPTVKASPLSWFDPEQVNILPEVKKVRDNELSCKSAADIQATDTASTSHETSLEQSTAMEMRPIADISEQKNTLEVEQVLQRDQVCDNDPLPQVDMQRENCTPSTDNSNHDEPSRTHEPDTANDTSPGKSDILGDSEPRKPAAVVVGPLELSLDVISQQPCAERTTDRVVPILSAEEQAPTVLESRGTTEGVPVPPVLSVSVSPTPASTGSPTPNERLNNRDLARIALVCAKGTGLTALQVIDWLASEFPYLQKGQGGWEKTIKSVLSLLPEIHGVRSPRQPVLYSFASAALRAKYEKQYRGYLQPIPVSGSQGSKYKARKSVRQQHGADAVSQQQHVQIRPPAQTERTASKAIKSAPSRRNVTAHGSTLLPLVLEGTLSRDPVSAPATDPVEIDTSAANLDGEKSPSSPSVFGPRVQDADADKVKITSNYDDLFHPFERTVASRPIIPLSDDLETKRGTSLRSIYPRTVTPTIETMTAEEKAAKIAEIKTRPKRKQFFGSGYRLAHVRRYGRQDIHDQGDGAWKPNSMTGRSMGEQDSAAMNECGENRSLLQVFNLPSNAIPMNDGKELAFRDGTLVNGRLPRPRQVYRVGKAFGSELTIR